MCRSQQRYFTDSDCRIVDGESMKKTKLFITGRN